ncbi:MAG TPA: IPT/TIG domain-containing protein [Trebonia sp.]|jgi:hypothetical protein
MTTPPEPGTENSQHGAVYNAAGTQLTASAAASYVSSSPANDPLLVVLQDIYETRVPDGTVYPAEEKILKFEAGQTVATSKWNAAWPTPTVTAITPATGAHTATTAVTVTGTGFTPGTAMHVGGAAVTSVTVISPNELTCTIPTGSAGAADVTITTDTGTTDLGNIFTYT